MDRKVCGGIVISKINKKYKILSVLQKEHKKWGPPKGGLEFLETNLQCARREIFEETGFDINIKNTTHIPIIIMNSTYFIIPINNLKKLYKNRINVIDNKEIDCVKWLDLKNLHLYTTNRHMKEIYKKRLEIINYFEKINMF